MAENVTMDELMSELRRQTTGLEERLARVALGFDNETYGRFLRHHDFNATKTAKALIEHSVSFHLIEIAFYHSQSMCWLTQMIYQRWRLQVRLDSIKPSSLVAQLRSGRVIYPGGLRDKKGRPYVILRARLNLPSIPFFETMRLASFVFEIMLKEK